MFKQLRFPIRFKILISLLLVITAVVSIITFTMANLFHTDKSAYVHDLTSEMAVHTAAETRALLVGYRERLQVFTRFMFDRDLLRDQKTKLLKQLFEDFHEFVAITIYAKGAELTTVYDAKTLKSAGLTKDSLLAYRKDHPLPLDLVESGEVFTVNSTLSDKLPTFTLAISHKTQDVGGKNAVVAAVIRLDGLLRLARRSKVFTTFIVDFKGNTLAHTDPQKVIRHKQVKWISEIKGLQGQRSHGRTLEYVQDGVEMVGGLAQTDFSSLLAGVQIPKAAAYLTARELLNNLIFVSLVLLLVSAAIGLFGSRLITRPLDRLANATKEIAKGKFDIKIESSSRDEINDLSLSFNQMATELNSREKALKGAQAALVQSEKMAAFGQLGAGIAHEIKNPLAGILGLTQLSLRKAEQDDPIYKNLSIIEKETNRCTAIIQNLLKFARQEKVAFEPVNINQVAQDAAAIVEHQLELHKVKLKKNFASSLPMISGNANQIQQVLLNLMINAQQAMEGRPGEVTVTTLSLDSSHVQVQISDNGSGIPEDVQAKIFEPFFTTKEVGKGTGLGLSVSYGIIKEHKGEIKVESSPEKGTTFKIEFPLAVLKTACTKCGQTFKIRQEHIGLKNKCKKCKSVFIVEEHT
ncbi:MAG: ATP-binding protein [Desulfobacterales bacterium]